MIFKTPILPHIRNVEIYNYQPLFKTTIKASVKNNRLLIIGGNALGKTTILQSIIYCIAGELDIEIEKIHKTKRWGRKYFQGRIKNLNDAYIRVEFSMGDDIIILERGFKTDRILSFFLNDEMIVNKSDANAQFEQYLIESGGYQSLNDFRFVIHKLCYLPEDRSNLVWDSEVQTRLIMIIFNDIIVETEFTEKRGQLKKLDSKARHLHVDLEEAKTELEKYKQSPIDEKTTKDQTNNVAKEVNPINEIEEDQQTEIQILHRLSVIGQEKAPIQNTLRALKKEISDLVINLENVQTQLAEREEEFILEQLDQFENDEVKLAIHKLIHRQLCPACGEKAENLAQIAQKHIQDGRCPLCGSEQRHKNLDSNTSPLLDAQLSELLQRRYELEKTFIDIQRTLENLVIEEDNLNFKYNEFKLKQTAHKEQLEDLLDGIEVTVEKDTTSIDTLADQLNRLTIKVNDLEKEHLEYIHRFNVLQSELEEKYAEFTRVASQRISRLGELYRNYATAFLGLPCQLGIRKADIKFLTLDLYIPEFNNQIRNQPETCSEAQRFFLDIAFRMSVIDLAKELSQTMGSFICETPENALDVVYVDNVALMFKQFCGAGHSLIATANLQGGGLAGPILYNIPQNQRENSILNLLKYANLSDVQKEHLSTMEAILGDIIGFNGGIYR